MPNNSITEVISHLKEFLNPEPNEDPALVRQKRVSALKKAEQSCGLGPFQALPLGAAMSTQITNVIGSETADRITVLIDQFQRGGLAAVPEVEAGVKKLVDELTAKTAS